MDLPDFGPPKLTPQQTPAQTPPRAPARRALALATGLAASFFFVGLAVVAVQRRKARQDHSALQRWSRNVDPNATRDGQELILRRQTERLMQKLVSVRELVTKARAVRGKEREVLALESALALTEHLIQNRYFEQADQKLEQIKRAVPPVPVSNPLAAPPKPIDVPAPPKETLGETGPRAPASAEPAKKTPSGKKPARKRRAR